MWLANGPFEALKNFVLILEIKTNQKNKIQGMLRPSSETVIAQSWFLVQNYKQWT